MLAQCGIRIHFAESVLRRFRQVPVFIHFTLNFNGILRGYGQAVPALVVITLMSTGRIFKHIQVVGNARRYSRAALPTHRRSSALYRRAAAVPGRQIRRLAFASPTGRRNTALLSRQNRGRTKVP